MAGRTAGIVAARERHFREQVEQAYIDVFGRRGEEHPPGLLTEVPVMEVLDVLLEVFSPWLFKHWSPVTRQAFGEMEQCLIAFQSFALQCLVI